MSVPIAIRNPARLPNRETRRPAGGLSCHPIQSTFRPNRRISRRRLDRAWPFRSPSAIGRKRNMDDKTDTALPAELADVKLADRFDLTKTSVLLTGAQAVARLLIAQKERDRRAGFNTGGFISGYRGSPVGGLDLQFARLKDLFKANDIHFEPGLNEELAATAIWGAQQAEMRGEGRFDGVFGLWYGKGPGVDRSGDVFRHANLAGTSPRGGVLALMGDDHTAESSTTAHQSEFAFVDVMIAGALAGRRAGDSRLRRAGLGAQPLRRPMGRRQMHQGHDRIDRRGRRLARSRPARHADGPRAAAGRPQHPNPRRRSRTGGAPAGAQARRGRRLARRQQDQPDHHVGRPRCQDRNHHGRKVLSRRAPGARRSRHRRGALQRTGPPDIQGRLRLAARARASCANSRTGSSSSSSSRKSAR